MASAPNGTIACAWLDLRETGTQIWVAFSRDNGAIWSKNVCVYRSPSGTVCECCQPSLAFDRQNRLYVMWRNVVEGMRDMYQTHINDNGKTFAPAQKLGVGTWALKACPMDGGSLAVSRRGVSTFWRRENTMYAVDLAGPEKREQSVGNGQQGWMTATDEGRYLVWLRGRRPGELLAQTPDASFPITLAQNANDLAVSAGSAVGTSVVAVWSTPKGIYSAILNPTKKND